eukprot:UN11731
MYAYEMKASRCKPINQFYNYFRLIKCLKVKIMKQN